MLRVRHGDGRYLFKWRLEWRGMGKGSGSESPAYHSPAYSWQASAAVYSAALDSGVSIWEDGDEGFTPFKHEEPRLLHLGSRV